MAKVIDCPCGEQIRGESEDETLQRAEQHVLDKHPDIADQFSRATLSEMLKDD
jgi:predicted small metal-binding protein